MSFKDNLDEEVKARIMICVKCYAIEIGNFPAFLLNMLPHSLNCSQRRLLKKEEAEKLR